MSAPIEWASSNPCIPMVVSAFVLNEAVASDPDARIAPITQPNYTFLRLEDAVIQNDLQDPVDLHYTFPASKNSRLYDLGSGQPHKNRLGVYLTWTIPRLYRSGVAMAPSSQGKTDQEKEINRQKRGYAPIKTGDGDYASPDFRCVPTRWLVVRYLDKQSIADQVTPDVADKIQCVAWVIDSDLKTDLEVIPDGMDLQVDYSPFITATTRNDNNSLRRQAEVFIGRKLDLDLWTEGDDVAADRPQLSVLNASNPIFADYQPHNSNVFSMVDNFNYQDDGGNDAILQHAIASYYVIGWHSKINEDPFHMVDVALTTLEERLDNLQLEIMNSDNDVNVQNWMKGQKQARTVCHGALYNVGWDANNMPPSPAQIAGKILKAQEPIAVGTTATDAILSYVRAHKDIDCGETAKLEKDIWNLGTLLLAEEDGVDKKAEASDLLYSYNFERIDGGVQWHMAGDPGSSNSFVPTDDQIKLRQMNDTQVALDNALRTEKKLKWDLFSEWWRFVSSNAQGDPKVVNGTQCNLTDLITRLTTLRGPPDAVLPVVCINSLQKEVKRLGTLIPVKTPTQAGAQSSFYTRKDPTLLIAGIDSAWPEDYLKKLKIRIGTQVTYQCSSKFSPFVKLIDDITARVPTGITGIAGAVRPLLIEFLSLCGPPPPSSPPIPPSKPSSPSRSDILPLYHDRGPLPMSKGPWRDQWGGAQPWWPLFVEWQAEYYHIPFSDWQIVQTAASTWEYQVKTAPDPPLWDQSGIESRSVSGRILLLPQPAFSLGNAITRLFFNVPDALPPDDKEDLLAHLPSIPFLSSPMSGLTDHLITLCRGTHIKPSQRPTGRQASTMDAAVAAIISLTNQSTGLPFTADQLSLIGQESQKTPYGDLVRLNDDTNDSPFKAATHGQMRFTLINIIDRFGQAICALDPDPSPKDQAPHISPILSDVYSPQEYIWTSDISGHMPQPNVVERNFPPKCKKCEFVQLPPGINQDSRLNFTFLFPNPKPPIHLQPDNYWLPCGDYDNPIWGWVLLNYADYGLQFFNAKGNFYREVRLGGLHGDVVSSPWKPFGPPPSPAPTNTKQLDQLLAQFTPEDTGPAYLQQFFRMIEISLGSVNPPPKMYASYLQSVIGKPFALTTFGVSLELATDALTIQTSQSASLPPLTLLPPTDPSQNQYQFQVKLGDAERPYDGMVGYWNGSPTTPGVADFSNLFTYFDPPPLDKSTSPTTVAITTHNLPLVSPFFVSPDVTVNNTPGFKTYAPQSVDTITAARVAEYSIFSAIVDPFVAIHAYSGILPLVSLQLPHWTVETAMRQMTAFFHLGPLLVPDYVPDKFDCAYEAGTGQINPDNNGLTIPALKSAKWAWLQPYDVPPTKTDDDDDRGDNVDDDAEVDDDDDDDDANASAPATSQPADKNTRYMALALKKNVDQRPRYEDGPYTAVEGYLQLMEPLMQAEAAKSKPAPTP